MAKHTGSLFITDKVIKPPPVQLIRGENRPHYRRSIIIEKWSFPVLNIKKKKRKPRRLSMFSFFSRKNKRVSTRVTFEAKPQQPAPSARDPKSQIKTGKWKEETWVFLFIGSRKFLIVTPWEASRQIAKNGAETFNHFKPSLDNKFPPIGKKKQNPTSYAKVQVILLRLQYASMLFRCSPDVSTQSNMEILGKQNTKENGPNPWKIIPTELLMSLEKYKLKASGSFG